jgi:hypothetical protein
VSAPRLAAIPFEHLEAELAAFPLASVASFSQSTISLNPLISLKGNDELWRAAERDILNSLPSVPLDEAATVRDKLWFYRSRPEQMSFEPVSLSAYLRRLAESYLDTKGHPIEAAVSSDFRQHPGPEARLRWSWMCRALPPDLLRAARGVPYADGDPFPLNPIIEQMLRDQGFAETHLHLGAALDFSLAWAALMSSLTRNERKYSEFASPGTCFEDGRDLCSWLLHAAVARLVLAEWLFHVSSSGAPLSIDSLTFVYFQRGFRLDVVECNRLAASLSELRNGRWNESRLSQGRAGSQEHLAKRFAQTRAIYRRLIQAPHLIRDRETARRASRALYEPESRDEVFASDPLARIVGWHPTEGVSPETLFVEAALRRIEQDEEKGEKDTEFARLFWQVVRVRCLLYRHVVQRPLTPGLQCFVRFFSRIKPLRTKISDSVLASTAARISGQGVGLRSLEVRLGTDESESVCLKQIRDLERMAHQHGKNTEFRFFRPHLDSKRREGIEKSQTPRFEVGALYHFSRKRGGGWEAGNPNAYGMDRSYPGSPRVGSTLLKDAGNPTGFRFAHFYLIQRRHAQALVSVYQKYPLALRTIRGVDLCTDEAGVPVWVMAPLVRWVREAGRQAATQLRLRGGAKIPQPRTSVHAGEDFVHLLSGLRRLDDAVTYLALEEGDRLGHALALGVDPSVWCSRVGRVAQTREERLFDLVWEWKCYAEYSGYGIGAASERLAYVRTEIVRLAQSIFDWSCSPEDLMNFADLLHDEQELRVQGFPDRPMVRFHNSGQSAEKGEDRGEPAHYGRQLLRAYLRDEKVWRRGRIPEMIDMRNIRHEQAALSQLQTGLRRKIGKLCLTIEVNPSSNLLIGDLGNFAGHPLWRLKPVAQLDDISPLSVCIGSDDPLTFATTLPHEYQLLFDTLILMGHSHDVAMKWIDSARDAGMQSRFTLPQNVEQSSQELRVPNLLGWERPTSPP